MANSGSVAPKERINITFKPATGNAQEEKELPLKMMVLGDFNNAPDDRLIIDRKPTDVNKNNFNDVLREHDVKVNFSVENKLSDEGEPNAPEELPISLQIDSIKDFEPDNIAQQVPELKSLMELREALIALKGPLGNVTAFKDAIQQALTDEEARKELLAELGLDNQEGK